MKLDVFFHLIKSLSEKEKKIFIKNRLSHKKPLFIKFFDVIDKIDKYNKIEIYYHLKKLKINIRSFKYLKSQLYNEVLEFLMESFRNDSAYEKINKIILQAKILQQRQFFDQAKEMIEEAEILAKKFEFHIQLLNIYDFKNNLNLNNTQTHLLETSKKIFEDKEEELKKYIYLSELQEIHNNEFCKHINKRLLPTDGEKEKLYLIKNKLKNTSINSFAINDYKDRINNIIEMRLTNNSTSYIYKNRIESWEKHEHIKQENKDKYLRLLIIYFNKSCRERNFDDAKMIIPKIEETQKEHKFINKQEEAEYYNSKLSSLVLRNDLKTAEKLIKDNVALLNSLDTNGFNSDINIACLYTIAHTYFCIKDFKQALLYCNAVLNKPKNEKALHIYIAARLLKITIQYEINDFMQMYDFYKASYMYFKRLPDNYEFELNWLLFINTLCKCDDNDERHKILINMREVLLKNKKVKFYEDSGIFYFMAYINSCLENKLYSQVLEEIAWDKYPSIFEMKF
ncbi:MAG: hypothetical protein A3K10_01965 [Bacteroidetes bacterium RIFCSPLOWO2_12_FULL_31_6]|nr:MAG: hypothetical protein A3K10_01965 [Bacteroidetes bacterium RIFCSPLOWO2_12_FULL_31_6]